MAKKERKTRRRKTKSKSKSRHRRVALTRLSSSVGMIEPVRIQPPTLVPSKGLEIKSQEESK
jgi:hypothetical protein